MDAQYTSKPVHVLFPLALFALGARALLFAEWQWFALACWVVGFVTFAWIVISGIIADRRRYWESVAEALEASAKNDYDKIALLGFNPDHIPQQITVTINKKDQHDQIEQTRNIYNLPVTVDKLRKLSDILINENAPFSRREYVDRRGLFRDWEWRKFQERCEKEKLIIPRTSGNGFELSEDGQRFFFSLSASPLPSPTDG